MQVRPYPKDDPSFDPNNIRFSCIKYACTMGESLSSSTRVDPRSGEILSATICIPHNVATRIRTDLFVQLGAAEPEARSVKLSPALFARALAADVARHTGACLGLAVNYAGSQAIPTDSLRSPSFTQRYGISASIMDALPYNFVAQPGDKERGVVLMQERPGVYDEYVVDWLYRPVAGAATPEAEIPELDRRIALHRGDPMYLYTPTPVAVALDPRAMPYNLGDDPVRASAWEFANYAYVMRHADEWIGTEDKDYTFRSLVQASVMNQLYYSFVSVSANLGGIYLNEKYENDMLPTYAAVPRERQRRALRYMLEQLEEMSWLDNHRLNKDVIEVVSLGEYCQDMLSEVVFKSLSTLDLSASKSEDPYTQREAMQELYDYILRDVTAGRESTEANLAMQRRLLIDVIRKAGVLEQTRKRVAAFADPASDPVSGPASATPDPASEPASASGFAPEFGPVLDKARLIRESHLQRTLSGRSPEEIEGVRPMRSIAFRVQPSTDYNHYELLLKMQQSYRQALRTGASERMKNHYRYMLLAIERALKVE